MSVLTQYNAIAQPDSNNRMHFDLLYERILLTTPPNPTVSAVYVTKRLSTKLKACIATVPH